MVKYYVVVNRHIIRDNRKTPGEEKPPLRVSRGKYGKPSYCNSLDLSSGRLVYDPANPLPCGATVYIELDELIVPET